MKKIITILTLIAGIMTSHATINYYNYTIKYTALYSTTPYTAAKYTGATKDLLSTIATAEFYAGYYAYSVFPVGARLVFQYNTDTSEGHFIVQDASKNFLCDVSDVLTLDISESVVSGAGSTYQETLLYDDTELGLSTSFHLSYLTTESQKLGVHTCKGSSGVGSGYYNGQAMVLTGSASSTTK